MAFLKRLVENYNRTFNYFLFYVFSNDTLISIVALFLSWFISLRTSLLSVGGKNKLSFVGLVKLFFNK